MTPVEFETIAKTIGPVAALILWLYLDYKKSKKEGQPKYKDMEELEESLQRLDRRVFKLEILNEIKDGKTEDQDI